MISSALLHRRSRHHHKRRDRTHIRKWWWIAFRIILCGRKEGTYGVKKISPWENAHSVFAPKIHCFQRCWSRLIIASAPLLPRTIKHKTSTSLNWKQRRTIAYIFLPENSALIALYSLVISRIESSKFERSTDDDEKEEVNENGYLSWSLYLCLFWLANCLFLKHFFGKQKRKRVVKLAFLSSISKIKSKLNAIDYAKSFVTTQNPLEDLHLKTQLN